MRSTTIEIGQEVWITGGLDRDKKGVVIGGGFGIYQVQLDSETKNFDRSNVSTTNPKNHSVPLPPNFIPCKFKVGDPVEVHGFGGVYDGIKGKVVRLPTSTSYRNGGDPRYGVEGDTISNRLYFEEHTLRTPVEKIRRVGGEIRHEDVRIGDTIRTELRTSDGTYSQLSSKQGKVARILKASNPVGMAPCAVYSFSTEKHHGLTFGQTNEKITLLETAPDPFIAIVGNLAAGTVVVHEKDSEAVLTYVKSLPFINQSQWHVLSSHSNRSSTFVDDKDVIDALNNGAEIVHKVRKKTAQVIPPPPPF